MKLTVYSIHDRKADIYNRPFYESNEVIAVRNVEMCFNDSNNPMCAYPDDFELVRLGTYDDDTGKFDILPIPELVEVRKEV